MTRIFTTLAAIASLLLLTNLVLGLNIGDYNAAARNWSEKSKPLGILLEETKLRYGADSTQVNGVEKQISDLQAELLPSQGRVSVHILVGIGAALAVVLVCSIAITYFIGTSRWVHEVVDTYNLDPQITQRSRKLKRQTFPWSLGGMLVVLGIIALGGASHPGTAAKNTADWVQPHYWGAMLGTLLILYCFARQWLNIQANLAIIRDVMVQVSSIRQEEPPTEKVLAR